VIDVIWIAFALGLTIVGLIYIRLLGDKNEELGS
jgi:hypothetical protein